MAMTRFQWRRYWRLLLTLTLLATAACSRTADKAAATAATNGEAADLAVLQRQLQDLQARTERVKDISAIKTLQRAYGYYMEKGLWDEAANLFADASTLELARDGVYAGKEHIRQYFYALGNGKQGLQQGQLDEQLLVMPVITLGDDGKSAKGRWRDIRLVGQFGQHAEWGEGPFENEYVKDKGVWKFGKVKWQQAILVPYVGGWAKNEDYNKGLWAAGKLMPDMPPTDDHGWWPEVWLLPFHFTNPVASPLVAPPAPASTPPSAADLKTLATQVVALQAEATRLEAEHDLENLQGIFGFYYDKNEWQQAADLFTDDATFEWGGSGVYVGKAHILAYLKSLGKEGPQEGLLNDQMQLQPIVTVAADGLSAKGRWHLFSQEAVHGVNHFWGTGIYENEYRNDNGVWKLS
ncbi:MAG TPA: nuclear transport factor 2 family protein, partial [Candidatus Acidoferrum sp.]|nr:nuclear transport factor 2 family protein [Candidatus Acidoferrum sp.]